MSKYFIPIAIVFQTLAVVSFLVSGRAGAVVLFGLASLIEVFMVWLDRHKVEKVQALESRMSQLESTVSQLHVAVKNW